MKDLTLRINRAAVPEWHIIEEPFTLETNIKKARRVVKWRKKKFVIRDPWTHFAFAVENGKTKHYVNGVMVKETNAMSPHQCCEKLGIVKYMQDLRLSNIIRPEYVS